MSPIVVPDVHELIVQVSPVDTSKYFLKLDVQVVTANSNMVKSNFHLIQTFWHIFAKFLSL